MPYLVNVNTQEELQNAISSKAQYINILNRELANHVKRVQKASWAVITAVLASLGIFGLFWWNPIGWTAAAVSGPIVAAVTYLVVPLGPKGLWNMYYGYGICGLDIAKLDNETIVEGFLILTLRRESN